MLAGVDTGFFYLLKNGDRRALRIWNESRVATSVLVVFELQRAVLKGKFKGWDAFLDRLRKAVDIVPVTVEIAVKAAEISHGTGIPAVDSLILASLLSAGCKIIYTLDSDFERYRKRGIRIVNLRKEGF